MIAIVFPIISAILQILGTNLLSGKLGKDAAAKYVGMIAALLDRGGPVEDGLHALKSHIEQMVLEGRDPTPDEWKELKARSDAAHATIQGS